MAGLILWYGLDVVSPINVIKPLSKYGSNKSCLSLFNAAAEAYKATAKCEHYALRY